MLIQVDESSEASYGSAEPINLYEHSRVALPAATQPRPRQRYVLSDSCLELYFSGSDSFLSALQSKQAV